MARRLSMVKHPVCATVNWSLIDYPTPSNLNYCWGLGSLAGLCLVIQILTGVFLAMHYTPHVDHAFSSVEHIMREVRAGWWLRYLHATGASVFFIAVYSHMFRGLYYGSFSSLRELVWCFGVAILVLMIATAFMGYVLPWGQMSFWAATVITSLAGAIPVFGETIVSWLWGGFAVDNATLNRFFSLHYLTPFVLVGASILHLATLHQYGLNNPIGVHSAVDKLALHLFFFAKDGVGWAAFAIFFYFLVSYAPNALGHTDNYIPANPMSTPAHIVPEWYFLPIYAILRTVPNKLGGVAAIGLVFLSLFALPFLHRSSVRSSTFRPIHRYMFWLLLADCLLLGWIGSQSVEPPMETVGQVASVGFFLYFAITPIIGEFEADFVEAGGRPGRIGWRSLGNR
uniref:Cytochrome b n=1 Tax=Selaginella moellendorffii TaxID=88036 RepID=F2YMP2_SELML